MILEITYDYTVQGAEDPFIHLSSEAAVESLRYGAPGATLCDILPIREEFPTLSPLQSTRTSCASKILAYMDAVLFLPTTRCLHEDARRETICLAVGLASTTNCTTIRFSLTSSLSLGFTYFTGE